MRYWPFVRGIHQSPLNFPHEGQRRGALMFSFVCAWTNSWVNNGDAGDLRRHRPHYDVIVMNAVFLQETHKDTGGVIINSNPDLQSTTLCAVAILFVKLTETGNIIKYSLEMIYDEV